jgi:dTDP-4-dehydrorhamnose 3,5-epimerase
MYTTLTRHPTRLRDVTLIRPVIHRDHRGFFLESYNKRDFESIGITTPFVQDNHSCSGKGVLRGLHYQVPRPQEKLVRVISGSVYDVAVDIRRESPTFGESVGVVLSAVDMTMIHIPGGFAHGFLALDKYTQVLYKTSDFFFPEYDRGIVWNDPEIGIPWPLEENGITAPLVSEKDARLPGLREIFSSSEKENVRT